MRDRLNNRRQSQPRLELHEPQTYLETQGQADLCTGVHPNRLNRGRVPLAEVLILNAPVTSMFRPNDNVVPNQGVNNPLVNQNLEGTINSNAYIDQVLANFFQQLIGLNLGIVVVIRSTFSSAI